MTLSTVRRRLSGRILGKRNNVLNLYFPRYDVQMYNVI